MIYYQAFRVLKKDQTLHIKMVTDDFRDYILGFIF